MQKFVKLKDPGTCRVFFSSPFGGMEEEREELTKKFFPQIHHACNAKGIRFVPVDMRWGITKEAADNAQVMNICLREVERSDYFVGFFGQRYGWHSMHGNNDLILKQNFDNAMTTHPWVNEHRERSMTEIEWRAGHLNNPGVMPACFCFRDKEFDDKICLEAETTGKLNVIAKYASESPFASEKLNSLIQDVLATQDKTYGVQMNYKSPQEGAKFIFDKVWHFVTEVVLIDLNIEKIPQTLKLRQVHEMFAKSKMDLYCGCQQYFDILDEKVYENNCKGVLMTGPAGCGKSSLLAKWIHSVETKYPHITIIYHFIGCAPGSERPKAILERLLLELKSAFPFCCIKSPEPENATPRNLDNDEKSQVDKKNNNDIQSDTNAASEPILLPHQSMDPVVSGKGPTENNEPFLIPHQSMDPVVSGNRPTENDEPFLIPHQSMDPVVSGNGPTENNELFLIPHQSMDPVVSGNGPTQNDEPFLIPHQSMDPVVSGNGPTENNEPFLIPHQRMDPIVSGNRPTENDEPFLIPHQRMDPIVSGNEPKENNIQQGNGNGNVIRTDNHDENSNKNENLNENKGYTDQRQVVEDDTKAVAKTGNTELLQGFEPLDINATNTFQSVPGKQVESDGKPGQDQNISEEENKEQKELNGKNEITSKEDKNDDKKDDKKDDKSNAEKKKTVQQLLNEVNILMKSVSDNGQKVVIIIDALNQQQKREKTIKHLYWLPESFPKEVSFICSSLDSDTSTYDLLVKEREMDVLSIEPYDSTLQFEICVESLKFLGKELSQHQLDRIVSSNETTNPLFLKLILYELSIYGNFRKLDDKIDSLIFVNGVKPLLQVIFSRLEEDYNFAGYNGNLLKDVLCCLQVAKKGLSESEITKILSIPSNIWSPLFFALEHLLVQYTGLLGFAFAELAEAVNERYLNDSSEITFYKKKLISFFDSTRQTMKPWQKNTGLEYDRVMEELPWLLKDIDDKENLTKILSDISVMKKLMDSNGNDLLELWQSTGAPWSTVTSLYINTFDTALISIYQELEAGVIDVKENSPGFMLRSTFQYMRTFFDIAYYADGTIEAMKREIYILENCSTKLAPEKVAEYLRDARYYLAVAHSDKNEYDEALKLYLILLEQCEKILKEKEDTPTTDLLAYVCNGIGLVYYSNGSQDYTKALEYLERSQKMHQQKDAKRHEASSLTNIGLVFLNQRRFNEALTTFSNAQKLYEDHYFGEVSLEMGNLMTNTALTYRRMKNLDKAEEFYHKSLEMKAKNVGWYHPVIATAFMNLGTLEVHRHNFEEAEKWTRKAINIYEINEMPITNRTHRMCRENLCVNLLKQNRQEEMIPFYLEVTNILVDNGWIGEGIVVLHREMINFMMEKKTYDYKQLEKILLALLDSPKRRVCFAYQLITLDAALPLEERPIRSVDLTLRSFVKEYPKHSKLMVSFVTDILAKENNYDEILATCLRLHTAEQDLKESAFSFAAEALIESKFYLSAKKILLEGLKKYPGHLELVNILIESLMSLNETKDLIPYLPVMLEATNWELLKEKKLFDLGMALESIDVELSGKCYSKLIQDGTASISKDSAEKAIIRLFPENQSSV